VATYLIGDVQGCFVTFQKLLKNVNFDPKVDAIILLGDAINRGPGSLEMLRYIIANQTHIELLLGNHEIFAIGLFLGSIQNTRPHTLKPLLEASDQEELFAYLRARPLIKRQDNNIFVHAGILPSKSIEEAVIQAGHISAILTSIEAKRFLERFYEETPTVDKPNLGPKKALRLALAYLTLLRMCDSAISMDLSYSGTIDKAPKRLKPWFMLRNDSNLHVYFGHWAALGLYHYKNYHCLDSGCAWGNKLTALRLGDQKIFQVDNCEMG
jgi:bis(5'-nucleosyl)-tetraphosphatase (symmetrical)